MLAPFAALLARTSDAEHWALALAAKALRADPARYQSVEGVEYDLTTESMFRWEIEFDAGRRVEGLVGLFPLDRLTPHEGTTSALAHRPRHPVQIRPVMALVDQSLPDLVDSGSTSHFRGDHHHAVTPVHPVEFSPHTALIADGHHRVAAALRAGGDPAIMTMIVSTDGLDLEAGAFHRVFQDVVPLPRSVPGCEVIHETTRDSIHAGRIALVTPTGSVGIAITDPDLDDYRLGLPAGLVADYLLPVLGLDGAEPGYVDTIEDALGAVEAGGTAIILPGSRIASIIAAAADGVTLPAKSTRFRPKPIRGLLMRPVPGL